MHDTAQKPEALSRTWRLEVAHKLDNVVISVHTYEVTLSRAHVGGELAATIDGQPAELKQAIYLIQGARKQEVVSEVLAPLPAPTIGKARAHRLHKILGRLGLHEHYGLATRATGRDVFSLASLTEEEARRVWAYVTNMLPWAAQVAA